MADSYTVHIYIAPPSIRSNGLPSVGHAYIGIVPNGSSGEQTKYYVLHQDNDAWYGILHPVDGHISKYDGAEYPQATSVGNSQLTKEQGEALIGDLDKLDPHHPYSVGGYGNDENGLPTVDGLNCVRWADKTLQDWTRDNGLVDESGNNPLDFYPDGVNTPMKALGMPGFPYPGYTPTLGGPPPSSAPDIAGGLCGVAAGVPVGSPIVLDLDGDGISLVAQEDSAAYFDLDNDGFREKTQWVAGTDGLLALDANANGRIDDKAELFGDEAGFADGYAKLASYDSNADGVIDASDAVFADLRIWQDADSDGYTDEGELKTLAELGIASLSLTADSTLSSTYTRTDGATGQTPALSPDHAPRPTTPGGDFNLAPGLPLSPSVAHARSGEMELVPC